MARERFSFNDTKEYNKDDLQPNATGLKIGEYKNECFRQISGCHPAE